MDGRVVNPVSTLLAGAAVQGVQGGCIASCILYWCVIVCKNCIDEFVQGRHLTRVPLILVVHHHSYMRPDLRD